MGTSTSFRAPPVPRWQAFTTALQQGIPLERVRSELFNAGRDWEAAIASPAIATFATAFVEAGDVLPDQLAHVDRPERALRAYVAATRAASAELGGTPARPLAERALTALLIRGAAGKESLATKSAKNAAQQLRMFLSARDAAVASYLGELLGHYARHVAAREIGRLTEGPEPVSVATARETVRRLALEAERVGLSTRTAAEGASEVREAWPSLVHAAFRRGRELPRESG